MMQTTEGRDDPLTEEINKPIAEEAAEGTEAVRRLARKAGCSGVEVMREAEEGRRIEPVTGRSRKGIEMRCMK